MGIEIRWTATAISNLEDIFYYYRLKVNIALAHKIVTSVIESTILLEEQPTMGQFEPLLVDRNKGYRYVLSGNYKIIYWPEDLIIWIASVFDTRQNPKKLKKLK